MQLSITHMCLGYALCYVNPLYFAVFLLDLLGIKLYTVFPDKEGLLRIERMVSQAALVKCTCVKHFNGRDVLSGFFLGKAWVVVTDTRTVEHKVHMLVPPAMYASLMKEPTHTFESAPVIPVAEKLQQNVQVYRRRGCYKNFYYIANKLDLQDLEPMGEQAPVLDDMVKMYAQTGRGTFFVHGAPCTGKSTLGYLLAKQLHGHYCHTFNPSDPGDTIHELLAACEVDSTSPLIVVLEEVDGILDRIATNAVTVNQDIPTEVHSKATWTAFLDDMIFLKYVVLILTSNKSKRDIDAVDPAFLRAGRVHASFLMTVPLVI